MLLPGASRCGTRLQSVRILIRSAGVTLLKTSLVLSCPAEKYSGAPCYLWNKEEPLLPPSRMTSRDSCFSPHCPQSDLLLLPSHNPGQLHGVRSPPHPQPCQPLCGPCGPSVLFSLLLNVLPLQTPQYLTQMLSSAGSNRLLNLSLTTFCLSCSESRTFLSVPLGAEPCPIQVNILDQSPSAGTCM